MYISALVADFKKNKFFLQWTYTFKEKLVLKLIRNAIIFQQLVLLEMKLKSA